MKRPLFDRRGHGAANTAQIGWDDDGQLAFAYLESADLLAVNWTSNRRLVLPMFGNYRHSIELALKAVIREAAACGRRDGLNDAELDPNKVNEDLAKSHKIDLLVNKLDDFLGRLKLGGDLAKIDNETREVLDGLHHLDNSGQVFRYSTVKVSGGKQLKFQPARPDLIRIDVDAVAAALHDASVVILDGVGTVLYYYEQWQRDVLEQGVAEA